jgi:hypothetical protein
MNTLKGPTEKQFSFGGCDFTKTSPKLVDLSASTPILNVTISFEDALKLNLALEECLRKLNSYKRSTVAGKKSAVNLAVHLNKNRVTINEGKL